MFYFISFLIFVKNNLQSKRPSHTKTKRLSLTTAIKNISFINRDLYNRNKFDSLKNNVNAVLPAVVERPYWSLT